MFLEILSFDVRGRASAAASTTEFARGAINSKPRRRLHFVFARV